MTYNVIVHHLCSRLKFHNLGRLDGRRHALNWMRSAAQVSLITHTILKIQPITAFVADCKK